MAQSLYDSKLDLPYHIRIYDDASTEYGISTLKELFPNATTIHRNSKTVKADKNIYLMYQDFLKTDDQYFFNADSDLIFRKDWLIQGENLLRNTDGILALLNLDSIKPCNTYSNLIEKLRLGSAGVIMSRGIIKKIIAHFSYEEVPEPGFDEMWCKYLRQNGKKILCVKDSLVQHIGVEGQNANSGFFEYGTGFQVDSKKQGQVFNDILLQLSQKKYNPDYFLFPYTLVRKNSKIVLYGYGRVGQNFMRQLKKESYCKVVGIVDKNWENINEDFVKSPKMLKNWSYDYIVIAVNSKKYFNQIKLDLLSNDNNIKSKIIFEHYMV